jgi:hypothetical protein
MVVERNLLHNSEPAVHRTATVMDRHRIEIEFDSEVDGAEWLMRNLTQHIWNVCDPGRLEISMTPVVDSPT